MGSTIKPRAQRELVQAEFMRQLLVLSREAGLELSVRQCQLIHEHVALMLEWNRTINLTRITQPEDILARHILDSMIPAQWLPRQGRMLDVGSGAGFPGVVLKVLLPQVHMTLVESNRKKISFLKVLQSRMDLPGLDVLASRWEEIALDVRQGLTPRWDVITMRAVRLGAQHLHHLAGRFLNAGGWFAFWAGSHGPAAARELEAEAGSAALALESCLPYRVPGLDRTRYLLLWKREGAVTLD
ncbi:MAG: 16S rRNA (guanine(527)-N(7))-methyltransferase RsmG [Syntrophobacteraceae bacterium]|nr:16S rRNA (guanine(527)-N(7))-methyltransferase RsmG [Syntrophobacteraceae bacterium]